jgi:hypothetical protein
VPAIAGDQKLAVVVWQRVANGVFERSNIGGRRSRLLVSDFGDEVVDCHGRSGV